jgi:hypothetical protein
MASLKAVRGTLLVCSRSGMASLRATLAVADSPLEFRNQSVKRHELAGRHRCEQ